MSVDAPRRASLLAYFPIEWQPEGAMDEIPVNENALWLSVLIQSTADLVGINLPVNRLRENKISTQRAGMVRG
jgi:hypothetical protein